MSVVGTSRLFRFYKSIINSKAADRSRRAQGSGARSVIVFLRTGKRARAGGGRGLGPPIQTIALVLPNRVAEMEELVNGD